MNWDNVFTGLNVGSSIIGGLMKNKQTKDYNKFLSQENEKNRQYNLMLAKMQNQWNIEQWNRENAYNDPSAQMSRLRNAGLNPDLMYQNGVSGITAASSPQLTAGSPSSVPNYESYSNMQTVGDMMLNALQAENLRAQTEKIKTDTKGSSIQNEINQGLKDGIIKLKNLEVRIAEADLDMKPEEKKKLVKEIEVADANIGQINQQIAESKQRASLMSQQEVGQMIDNYFKSAQYKAALDETYTRIKQMNSNIDISYKQLDIMYRKLPYELGILEETMFKTKYEGLSAMYKSQNDAYDAERYKSWRDTQDAIETAKELGLNIQNGMLQLQFDGEYNSYGSFVNRMASGEYGKIHYYAGGLLKAIEFTGSFLTSPLSGLLSIFK